MIGGVEPEQKYFGSGVVGDKIFSQVFQVYRAAVINVYLKKLTNLNFLSGV